MLCKVLLKDSSKYAFLVQNALLKKNICTAQNSAETFRENLSLKMMQKYANHAFQKGFKNMRATPFKKDFKPCSLKY